MAAIGGPAGVDAKLAGADTVYIAIPVNRVLVFTVASRTFSGSRSCAVKALVSPALEPSRIFLREYFSVKTGSCRTVMR